MQHHEYDNEEDESKFTCKLCPFQTNTSQHLTHHTNIKHKSGYRCRSCDTNLESKSELDKHIIKHHKSYKPCRSFENNSCEYDKCRYNHVILKDIERFCYRCGDRLKNQTDLKNTYKIHIKILFANSF